MIIITTNKSTLDVDMIHSFLTETYWAKGRTVAEVQKTIEHSFCFGVYLDGNQIGFARVVTDYTVFAYIMDVFILPKHRSKGYSKELMKRIMEEPSLENCSVWMLKTSDAHSLYTHYGFNELAHSEKLMERIIK